MMLIKNEVSLTNKEYLLEKFPGKGGWTYAKIPEIPQDRKSYFGFVKVKGHIDGYPISKFNLMPMGDGTLMCPVNAKIRKTIGKNVGDKLTIQLYLDSEPETPPDECLQCLQDEPEAWRFFNSLSTERVKKVLSYIYSAPNDDTKILRMGETIDLFLQGKIKT
ncbi:MAG: YdeI/OmpD-associated family protein [Saprospiraceae bacterium]